MSAATWLGPAKLRLWNSKLRAVPPATLGEFAVAAVHPVVEKEFGRLREPIGDTSDCATALDVKP
jgi:hypothetical protein